MISSAQAMRLRDAAIGKIPCDLLIEHANVLDVFSRRFYVGDVAIIDGYIVALGQREARQRVDASGQYLTPGLIDAHIHIESTLVTPDTLNDILLPRGVTDIIADPHEIANVSGTDGVDYMLACAQQLELGVHIMLPSCVPSTPLEHAGAVLSAEDLAPYYGQPGVLGLAEVMNAPGVAADPDMLQKLLDAHAHHAPIDGHGSTLDDLGMDLYTAMGICTDHECVDAEGLAERVKRGMYVHVRQGTVTKNLKALLPGITHDNAHRICFCTDDKHLDELMEEGGIDSVVRLAMEQGLDPAVAFSCATFSPASCYHLTGRGAVAPGYLATLVLWDASFRAKKVFQNGAVVAEEGRVLTPRFHSVPLPDALTHSVNPAPVDEKSLALPLTGKDKLNVIGVVPGNVLTDHLVMTAPGGDFFSPDAGRDLAKLCVIERHHQRGNLSVCAVTGFQLKKGAIATTVAHDSHNIIVIGMNDGDILLAIDALQQMQGGYVVVEDGRVTASVPLEVSGLMSARDPKDMQEDLSALHQAAHRILGQRDFNPFQMLSFISVPVIPSLKLTDVGLIDVQRFCPIDPAFSSERG